MVGQQRAARRGQPEKRAQIAAALRHFGLIPVYRIGVLSPFSSSYGPGPSFEAFRQTFRELGYIDGRNVTLEYRWADGRPDRFPELAAELVRLPVDVVFSAWSTPAALATKKATNTIPVIFAGVGDAVGVGLVASLARPGGNVTGSTFITAAPLAAEAQSAKAPRVGLLGLGSAESAPLLEAFRQGLRERGWVEGQYEVPAALDQVRRILAISSKRTEERLVNHLTEEEMRAMLEAPDPSTRSGIRDQAMLYLGFAAGLRVSELVGLRRDDLELDGPYPSILVRGKGRTRRRLPLWKEATRALRAWLAVRGDAPVPEVFVNGRGEALTCSGFTYLVKKYAQVAMPTSPGLSDKKVSPHVLRHTCAMNSLQATRDIRKVALWLGHSNLKSTEIYLRADPTEKLNAIESALPPNLRRGVFHVEDRLIAWLSGTTISGVDPRSEPVTTTLSAPDS